MRLLHIVVTLLLAAGLVSAAGSRCGNVDLIGYCEDQCGSGDGAVCTNNKPVCACDGSDGKAGEGEVDVPTPVVASSGGSRYSATMALAAFMPAVAMVVAGLVNP